MWTRLLRLAAMTAALVVLYYAVPVSSLQEPSSYAVRIVLMLLCLGAVTWLVLRHIRTLLDSGQDGRVDGLVAAVVIALLAFALAYYALETHRSGQVVGLSTRLDALYYTVTTLTTTGYGDIHAEGQTARGIVLVQLIFDVVVIAASAAVVSGRIRAGLRERHATARADAESGRSN